MEKEATMKSTKLTESFNFLLYLYRPKTLGKNYETQKVNSGN